MRFLATTIIFFQLCVVSHRAQNQSAFIWPLDPPLSISGNYGEIRPNHFHAGIDFSTRNQVGLPVHAVADGYVSRIRVSPYGYGRCVYITHPGGNVTVYAHLNSFGLKIVDLVRREQDSLRNYEVELLPRPNTVPVTKGEIIGLSGNSGGSTGPHLHFEIRDQQTETPLNALKFYQLSDKVKPVLQHIALYSLADTCLPLILNSHRLLISGDSGYTLPRALILGEAVIGVAFAGYDKVVAGANANNIYAARLFLDSKLIYSHELNRIDFSDNRYVNEFSDQVAGIKYQKCFMPTLFPRGIYTFSDNRGRIFLKDTLVHTVRIEVRDESGNATFATFKIKTTNLSEYAGPKLESPFFVDCRKDFSLQNNGISVSIPKGTLYNCTPLIVENNIEVSSKVIVFPDVNLKSSATIGFKCKPAEKNADKLVLRCKGVVYIGILRKDSVVFQVKNFGIFSLLTDLQPPAITPPRISKRRHPHSLKSVVFRITDNLSGIARYQVLANDKWVLAEYDAKSDQLIYYFDDSTPKGKVKFTVEVTDKVGNTSTISYYMTH